MKRYQLSLYFQDVSSSFSFLVLLSLDFPHPYLLSLIPSLFLALPSMNTLQIA